MKPMLCAALTLALPLSWAQHTQFVQAELLKTIKAKNAKPGDAVKARTVKTVALPGGVTLPEGATVIGQVRAADANSVTIVFDHVETKGGQTALVLSIRAAMMPDSPQISGGAAGSTNASSSDSPQRSTAAQTGSVIGMPEVTLDVDISPDHASRFHSSGKDLQLKQGLQLMLAAVAQ